MSVRGLLLPVALLLGLAACFWAPRNGPFDDPDGDAAHILIEDEE